MAKTKERKEEVVEVVDVRRDTLKKTLNAANKLFGEGAIFRGGDSPRMNVEAISTGSLGLDNALGVGGLPKGRIVEVSGPEASGKTLISLSTIAEVQRKGGVAAFIDVEHALTPDWAISIGVDWDNLLLSQPDSGERALSIVKFLIESGNVDIIVIDSVAALVTKREIEGDMDAQHMALTARLMSLALKKLTPLVSKSKTCCIFINQIRENVGVMYGPKETTPGGKALKFYSSVRLKVWKVSQGAIKKGENQIGHRVAIQVVKNKVAPPFRKAEFDIYYTSGIDKVSEISELAVTKGVVEKPNARTYIFGDAKWTSREDFDNAIKNDKALADALLIKIKEAMTAKVDDSDVADVIEVDGKIVDRATGEIIEEAVSAKDVEDEFSV